MSVAGSPQVLHVTESMGAGTATAIGQYVALPGHRHRLLARVRRDSFRPEPWLETVPHELATSVPALVQAWRRARRQPCDVVHAHSTVAGLLVRLLPHPTARTVLSPHASAALHHRRRVVRLVLRLAERVLAGRSVATGAVSDNEARELRALGRGRPVVVVPHALPASTSPRALPDPPATVCAVGRLGYQKAPEDVASLPALLAEQGLDLRWTWIGDGDPDRAQQLRDGGWQVTGWVGHDEVRARVGTALALVHPARYEGLSLAVVEAGSLGTPVVARRIPANEGIGGVVLCTDAGEMAAALAELARDPGRWSELGAAGTEHARTVHGAPAQHAALRELYGTPA